MGDKTILVTQLEPRRFRVIVREGKSETRHEVTAALAGGVAAVEAAFAFLLDREPKEAILQSFDLSVIARYFPEFDREFPLYLARNA